MNKQFFTLIVSGAICAANPIFAMDKEENITSNSVPVSPNPSVEETKVTTTGILCYDEICVRGAATVRHKWVSLDINCLDDEKCLLNLKKNTIYNGEHVYRKIN
jgi:hypothetical protein